MMARKKNFLSALSTLAWLALTLFVVPSLGEGDDDVNDAILNDIGQRSFVDSETGKLTLRHHTPPTPTRPYNSKHRNQQQHRHSGAHVGVSSSIFSSPSTTTAMPITTTTTTTLIDGPILCPEPCSCLGTLVDCSRRDLTSIPADLPVWVTILELQQNSITSVSAHSFALLRQLKQLDLSHNKIRSLLGDADGNGVFDALVALTELKLNKNELSSFPRIGRDKLEHLRQLHLHKNRITNVTKDDLSALTRLETLDLNHNLIRRVDNAFPADCRLRQLLLANNRLSGFDQDTFLNLGQLETLKLSKNELKDKLPRELFVTTGNLLTLDLSRNKLREVEGLTFYGLRKLRQLRLRRNRIGVLGDGCFWGLERLENLHLDHNNVTTINKKWTYGLGKMKKLTLTHNQVSRIHVESFEFTEALEEMDLSHNRLRTIDEDTFDDLATLQILRLGHNQISHISEAAFRRLPHLDTLDLSHNKISTTIEDVQGVFGGLDRLSKIDLADNEIKSIAKKAFVGLERLRSLDLTENPIATIQANVFDAMPSLLDLRLNSTNFLCDCQLSWFALYASTRRQSTQSRIHAICAHPPTLKGRPVVDVQQSDFLCEDFPKPVIVAQPRDKLALLEGQNDTLQCTAASSSLTPVTFQWKKDDILISNAPVDNYAASDEEDDSVTRFTTILHLLNIRDDDSGLYQCVISNQFGASYSKRANVNVYTFPVFKKVPVDVTVKTGSMARLECAADGRPAPEIAWQKDGGHDFPAARDRRMHVQSTDEHVFFITNVKTIDEGTYSCTATNAAGTIVANASLSVLEIPFITKPMAPQRVTQGATAVMECLSSGSPRPKITWMKNKELLEMTPRHFLTGGDQILLITDSQLSDAGSYTCVVTNTLGTAREESRLEIVRGSGGVVPNGGPLGGANGDESSNDAHLETKAIVVIAVVVCIVGTSCIWLLVIFLKTKFRGSGRNIPVMAKFAEASACSSSGSADSRSQSCSSGGARSSLVGRGSTGSTSGGTSGNGSQSHVQQQQLHPHGHYDGKRGHRSPGPFAPSSYDETASSPVAPLAWNYGGDIHESRPELRRHSSGATIHSHAASAPQYIVGGNCGETFSKTSETELLNTISPESLLHQQHLQAQATFCVNKPPLRVAEDTSKFSHHGAVTVHALRQEAALATVAAAAGKPLASSLSSQQQHQHIYSSSCTLPPPSPQQLRRTAPPSPLPPLHRLVEEGSSSILNRFDTSLQSSIDVPSASTQMTSCDELAQSGERTIDDDDDELMASSLTSSAGDPPYLYDNNSSEAEAAFIQPANVSIIGDDMNTHLQSTLSASPSANSSPLVIPKSENSSSLSTTKTAAASQLTTFLPPPPPLPPQPSPPPLVPPPPIERRRENSVRVSRNVVSRRPQSETLQFSSYNDDSVNRKNPRVTSCTENFFNNDDDKNDTAIYNHLVEGSQYRYSAVGDSPYFAGHSQPPIMESRNFVESHKNGYAGDPSKQPQNLDFMSVSLTQRVTSCNQHISDVITQLSSASDTIDPSKCSTSKPTNQPRQQQQPQEQSILNPRHSLSSQHSKVSASSEIPHSVTDNQSSSSSRPPSFNDPPPQTHSSSIDQLASASASAPSRDDPTLPPRNSSPPPLPQPSIPASSLTVDERVEVSSPSQCPFPGPETSVGALPPRPLPLLPAMLPRPDSEAIRDSLFADGAVAAEASATPATGFETTTRESTLESFTSSSASRSYALGGPGGDGGVDTCSSSSSFDILSSPSGAGAAVATTTTTTTDAAGKVSTGILPDSLLLRAAATAALRGRSNSSGSRSPGGSIGGILSPIENFDNAEDI